MKSLDFCLGMVGWDHLVRLGMGGVRFEPCGCLEKGEGVVTHQRIKPGFPDPERDPPGMRNSAPNSLFRRKVKTTAAEGTGRRPAEEE